jgi:hypothetical protein
MFSNMRCTWHYPADANMEHRATRGTVREIVDLEGSLIANGPVTARPEVTQLRSVQRPCGVINRALPACGLLHVSVYVLSSVL